MCAPPPLIAFISTSTSFAVCLGLIWVYEPIAGRSGQLALRISNHDTSRVQSKRNRSDFTAVVFNFSVNLPISHSINCSNQQWVRHRWACQLDAVIWSICLDEIKSMDEKCIPVFLWQLKQANSTQNRVAVPNLCTTVPSIFTVKTQKYVLVMGKSGNVRLLRMCLFSENQTNYFSVNQGNKQNTEVRQFWNPASTPLCQKSIDKQ